MALALAPAASGCSFLFSEAPPADFQARATFTCGDGYAPPIVDTIVAGLFAASLAGQAETRNATIAKATPGDRAQTRQDADVAIGVTAAFTAITAAGAAYGYTSASSCRDAREERRLALARARVLPPPYGMAPYGYPPPLWPPPRFFLSAPGSPGTAAPPAASPAFAAPPPKDVPPPAVVPVSPSP
jgi:hypothetical protein